MRTTQTEMGHLGEAFTRVALANPRVHCTLQHNDRSVYDLPATDELRGRIAAFFGHDLAADLIAVSSLDGELRLRGYVASPSHSRANARLQYLFLNGRAIRDRALQHALGEAFRGLLLTGRYPIAFLHIEMPADLVDVNVHPTKLEVRFQDSGRIYSQLLGTLRTKFLTTDLTARLQPVAENEAAAAVDPAQAEQMRRELVDWAKGQLAGFVPADDALPGGDLATATDRIRRHGRPTSRSNCRRSTAVGKRLAVPTLPQRTSRARVHTSRRSRRTTSTWRQVLRRGPRPPCNCTIVT